MTSNVSQLPNNSKAIVSMVFGIIGWVIQFMFIAFNLTFGALLTLATLGLSLLCLIPVTCVPPILWIVSIITGHTALSEIKSNNSGGRGMAMAGLIMGYLGIGMILLGIIIVVIIIIIGGGIASIPFLNSLMQK